MAQRSGVLGDESVHCRDLGVLEYGDVRVREHRERSKKKQEEVVQTRWLSEMVSSGSFALVERHLELPRWSLPPRVTWLALTTHTTTTAGLEPQLSTSRNVL